MSLKKFLRIHLMDNFLKAGFGKQAEGVLRHGSGQAALEYLILLVLIAALTVMAGSGYFSTIQDQGEGAANMARNIMARETVFD